MREPSERNPNIQALFLAYRRLILPFFASGTGRVAVVAVVLILGVVMGFTEDMSCEYAFCQREGLDI